MNPRAGQPAYGLLSEGSPAISSFTVGWVEHTAGKRSALVWGWYPGDVRKEASTAWFEGGIVELGWDPAARWVWSPPTVERPQPWRSCYHPSPPITCRNSPPFSSPADVLWLRLRKITTPILDTSSSGTESEKGICHILIKSNFPYTHSYTICQAGNCPVSFNTCSLCCHCAQGAVATSTTPIYIYNL